MQFIAGILIGASLGFLVACMFQANPKEQDGMAACAKCREQMCRDCQDIKVLQNDLDRARTSVYKMGRKYSRTLYNAWESDNKVSRMG